MPDLAMTNCQDNVGIYLKKRRDAPGKFSRDAKFLTVPLRLGRSVTEARFRSRTRS